jgi:hypothetical protein
MRSGQKQDRDGDCDDYNKQRIDAALYGGSVGVDFWGHGVFGGMGLRGCSGVRAKFLKKIRKIGKVIFFKLRLFFAKSVNALEWYPYEEKSRE